MTLAGSQHTYTHTYIYSTYTCNTAEYHSSIDANNKYEYKHPLVLSSLRQVTLHDVRSKVLSRQT